jgi:hypothetical protein
MINPFKNTNWKHIVGLTLIFGILTFISLVCYAAREEGTLGNGLLRHMFADMFLFFRFPMHVLFFDNLNNFPSFLFALLLNCVFYGWLSERLIFLSKNI